MLDTSAENLYVEAEAAIKLRQAHTAISREMIERYAGGAWRSDWHPDPSPENHYFEYAMNTLPQLVFANPKTTVSSRRPVVQRELAEAMEHALNRWVVDIDLAEILDAVGLDLMFDFGVAMLSLKPLPGYVGPRGNDGFIPARPYCRRISPRRFFMDALATSPEEARLQGHIWIRDIDDLLARAERARSQWSREALEQARIDCLRNHDEPGSMAYLPGLVAIQRNRVAGLEIYVPEKRQIYTVGIWGAGGGTRKTAYLRPPRAYFGPPTGPYVLFGLYGVPDQLYPLSPLAITHDEITEINAHATKVSRDAAGAKRLAIVESSDPDLANILKNGRHGNVYTAKNLGQNFIEVELGGPQETNLSYIATLRERLDRKSGLTDVRRGNITGRATATEVTEASAAGDVRTRYQQQRFRKDVELLLNGAGWYMFHSESVVFSLPMPAADGRVGEFDDATFLGGVQPGQEQFRYEDLELRIEPMSMVYTDSAALQQRATQLVQMALQIAPAMLQFPFIEWEELINFFAQTINERDLSRFFNFERYQQIMAMQGVELGGLAQPREVPQLGTAIRQLQQTGALGGVSNLGGMLQDRYNVTQPETNPQAA